MYIKKSEPESLINLQNGEYCHLTKNAFIINDNLNLDVNKFKVNLEKTTNTNKLRILINVLFTLLVFSFAIYSQFYPIALLMFLAVWDLRQIKRKKLPINKSKVIPFEYITSIEIKKGKLGFNYMDIYLTYQGKNSLVPLKLYDSESTLQQAKLIASKTGKLVSTPEEAEQTIKGSAFKINEISAYVLQNNKWHYIENNVFNRNRIDNYHYLRLFSYFLLALGTFMISIKTYLIVTNYSNYIDYLVVALLVLLLAVPLKYTQKALPNTFLPSDILSVKSNKKKYHIVLKNKIGFNLKIHVKKKFIDSESLELIKNNKG